ncbi:IclR family transcriptional regulator domain-containing protein [Streptomyces naphthomycinicus]|uniref:IclR family transcriptional regulator domain-containing protein n=1 Tax=Streptomyces naphthomycinicus TaxID=2872625 RepID=UPI001CED0141|nr:IclR family transcriptional regulator C-terminal domain-containing protein [Streptomyces sp. TML10]
MPAMTAVDADARAGAGTPAEAVGPLLRGVGVLRRLAEAGGTLSPSALERATGLARSTVDRITATLARMGYVRLDGQDVVLAPRVMELGNAYLAALRLPALLGAHADALADELDESVSLAVADLDGIRFIHQATRRRALSVSFRIGDLLPAERTAPGALFATEWTEADWTHWRARRAGDPQDTAFPAVPPRTEPTAGSAIARTEPTPAAATAPSATGLTTGSAYAPSADPATDRTTTLDLTADRSAPSLPTPTLSGDSAFVERVAAARRDGWALDDQLIEPGLVAVSVPVRHPDTGRLACAASVVSHTSRHSAAGLRTSLLPRLRTAVAAMEADLRTAPAPAPEPGPAPAGLATWTTASKYELGRDFVESLARGLTVLTAFGEGRAALSLTEVAGATGLSRATARRALLTHEHLGLVAARPDRTFALTPRVLDLGFPPLSRTTLPRLAEPHLRTLADRLHEPTALAVLTRDGKEIQYTAGAGTSRVLTVHITVGTRLPADATSLGRVLLANLAAPGSPALTEIRTRGYALVDEELETGLRSIAVPVRDRTGRAVAALNVATHAARRTLEECVEDLLPALHATADRVQRDFHAASRFTHVPTS